MFVSIVIYCDVFINFYHQATVTCSDFHVLFSIFLCKNVPKFLKVVALSPKAPDMYLEAKSARQKQRD